MVYPTVPLDAIKAPGRYSMVGGPFGSKLVTADYVADGIPVIRGANLPSDRRFSFDDLVYVSEAKVRRDLFGNIARPGDVVVTQRGTLGQVGLIPDWSPYREFVVSQSQMKLTVDGSKADAAFVYYALRSAFGQHEIQSKAISAGVPHINLSVFEQIRIPLPGSLDAQVRIAAVLTAYDDLIDNNRRRIKILEEMARRIYHEWFVDFRFPGHKPGAVDQTEFGRIPSGWAWHRTSAAIAVNPDVPRNPSEVRAFVPMASLSESTMIIGPIERRTAGSGSRFANGDTLFARITPCLENGKTGYVQFLRDGDYGNGSTEFIVLRSRLLCPELVYLLARDDRFRAHAKASMSGASGRQRVRDSCFDTFMVPVPPNDLIQRFVAQLRPMFELVDRLHRASEAARTARDTLLPQLISGAVDVTGIDTAVPRAAPK